MPLIVRFTSCVFPPLADAVERAVGE